MMDKFGIWRCNIRQVFSRENLKFRDIGKRKMILILYVVKKLFFILKFYMGKIFLFN